MVGYFKMCTKIEFKPIQNQKTPPEFSPGRVFYDLLNYY